MTRLILILLPLLGCKPHCGVVVRHNPPCGAWCANVLVKMDDGTTEESVSNMAEVGDRVCL